MGKQNGTDARLCYLEASDTRKCTATQMSFYCGRGLFEADLQRSQAFTANLSCNSQKQITPRGRAWCNIFLFGIQMP